MYFSQGAISLLQSSILGDILIHVKSTKFSPIRVTALTFVELSQGFLDGFPAFYPALNL